MSSFSIFHCCPLVFLTMNPAETKHSLTLIYSVDGKKIHTSTPEDLAAKLVASKPNANGSHSWSTVWDEYHAELQRTL